MITNYIDYIQIISAILLIICVLLQNRGAGLGSAFGGEGNIYRSKRGLEQYIFIATITFSIVFLLTALVRFLIKV